MGDAVTAQSTQDTTVAERVRIGGASGFWGDSIVAVPQLVRGGDVDYLTFDYLSEVTMSILARARAKDPALGYATDFIDAVCLELPEIVRRGIRIVANAGGINPRACAAALRERARALGYELRIAVVEGDDVSAAIAAYRAAGGVQMFGGEPLPERIVSANAYLGAVPIASALDRNAQIVITGRCVDSALVLGIAMHEFAWTEGDLDRLAGGTLAGHIIECGAQATGGLHTDWERTGDWATIGYPVVELYSSGRFVLTKPPGTGGLIAPAVVAEQMLYEIGDPSAYVMPDVVCDFSNVHVVALGRDEIEVSGAIGRAPTSTYKVSATYLDGMRSTASLTIVGVDAARKAERTAEAILKRTRAMFAARGLADYRATHVETIGAEWIYGPHARASAAREVMLRLVVDHDDPAAHKIFAREIAPAGTSYATGTTGGGGRPQSAPIVKLASYLMLKRDVTVSVDVDGVTEILDDAVAQPPPLAAVSRAEVSAPAPAAVARPALALAVAGDPAWVTMSLMALAYARSGDKGDLANIGVIARDPADLPLLRRALTAERVGAYFAHLATGPVHRYDVPGISALNFVIEGALGGGGMASMRYDPLAKGFAQILLDFPVDVPIERARTIRTNHLRPIPLHEGS